jgi:hypothetical protein
MYCLVSQMTTTRMGIICNQASESTATAFAYGTGGLLYGANAIMSDGSKWQLYYDPTSTTSNVLMLGPNMPSPPPPVRSCRHAAGLPALAVASAAPCACPACGLWALAAAAAACSSSLHQLVCSLPPATAGDADAAGCAAASGRCRAATACQHALPHPGWHRPGHHLQVGYDLQQHRLQIRANATVQKPGSWG